MRIPDRSAARARIRLTTTGLAVGGAVGVLGVTSGLAIQDHTSVAATHSGTTSITSPTPGTDSSPGTGGVPQTRPRHHRSSTSGLSNASGQSQAQSSGS